MDTFPTHPPYVCRTPHHQDYLHQARNPTLGPASRSAFHFRFFLTPQQPNTPAAAWDSDSEDDAAAAAAGSATSSGSSPQFELVQLVLVPPPPPRTQRPPQPPGCSGSSGSQPLSAGARLGLLKLLQMCGLGEVEAEEEGQGAEGAGADARLTTFLPEAAEVRALLAVCGRKGSDIPTALAAPLSCCAAAVSSSTS